MILFLQKKYDKRDDFDFEIVNFSFIDGDVPHSTSYGVYISQLIRFARASSCVADFNTSNKLLTYKLLKQGYGYHKLRKTFSKFYRRYYDLISKLQVGLKSLFTGVIPISLFLLATGTVLRKAAIDRGVRLATGRYGCRYRGVTS